MLVVRQTIPRIQERLTTVSCSSSTPLQLATLFGIRIWAWTLLRWTTAPPHLEPRLSFQLSSLPSLPLPASSFEAATKISFSILIFSRLLSLPKKEENKKKFFF